MLSTKGGPGKTTVTANLGAFCADANLSTLPIDLDTHPCCLRFIVWTAKLPAAPYQLISQNETIPVLAAREFYRGTQQLLKDLAPLASLGVHTPPLNIVINKLNATNDASLIYQSLVETLADHPQINLLDTTIPAAVSFRRVPASGSAAQGDHSPRATGHRVAPGCTRSVGCQTTGVDAHPVRLPAAHDRKSPQ
nr:ParA family protein [Pseudomonas sp. CFII64]